MRHTPGPWEFTTTSGGQILIRSPLESDTRTPGYFAEVRRFTLDRTILIANASLIAAAPDLLAACRAALDWTALDGDGISDPVRSKIEAAIKKAESRKL